MVFYYFCVIKTKIKLTFKTKKMKKTFLTLALASAIGVVAAQKPAAGTMGFTAGLANGLSGGLSAGPSKTGSLQFKYYISEGMAARIGINLTTPVNGTQVFDTTEKTPPVGPVPSVQHQKTKITSGGLTTAISLGIQKSLGGTDKLDVYTGADVYFAGTTSTVEDNKNSVVAVTSGTTTAKVGDYTQSVATNPPGGMRIGLNGFVGFQYFLVEKLSLGAEFAYGYYYNSSGNGTISTVNSATTNGVAGTTVATGASTTTSSTAPHVGQHAFGNGTSTVTLSFYF
jgi:uncharacterized protein YfiM (DUF2279 family)